MYLKANGANGVAVALEYRDLYDEEDGDGVAFEGKRSAAETVGEQQRLNNGRGGSISDSGTNCARMWEKPDSHVPEQDKAQDEMSP